MGRKLKTKHESVVNARITKGVHATYQNVRYFGWSSMRTYNYPLRRSIATQGGRSTFAYSVHTLVKVPQPRSVLYIHTHVAVKLCAVGT